MRHVQRRAANLCFLLLLMCLEAFVSDRGFSGLQGLIRMIFSCSHEENVGLSNPTDKQISVCPFPNVSD